MSKKRFKPLLSQLKAQAESKPDVANGASSLFAVPNFLNLHWRVERLLVALFSAAIYLNSLSNGFVYDDRPAVLENRNIYGSDLFSWPWLKRLVSDDFWGNALSNPGSHKSYRPLVTLSFALQRLLIGNLSDTAFPFHIANLMLHLCVVDQVFQLGASLAFKSLDQSVTSAVQRSMGLVSALLFACHPVHVEAVSSVVGRAELLGALFALLSFKRLDRYLSTAKSNLGDLCQSLTFALSACLSKENAVSIVLINLTLIAWQAIVKLKVAVDDESVQLVIDRNNNKKRQTSGRRKQQTLQLASSGRSKRKLPASSRRQILALLGTLSVLLVYVLLRAKLTYHQQTADGRNSHHHPDGSLWWRPKFSYADNPLAQEPRQFCIRQQMMTKTMTASAMLPEQLGRKQTSSQPDEVSCNNQDFLATLRLKMVATRLLVLPSANLKQLVWPSLLSYDWSLEALGGLLESPIDLRLVPSVAALLGLAWLSLSALLRLVCDAGQRRQADARATTTVQPARLSPNSDDACQSDSGSSVHSSAFSCKSADSGFVDCHWKSAGHERSSQTRDVRVAYLWPLVWLVLAYLPASNMLLPVGFLLAERALYLPSVGLCLAAATWIERDKSGWLKRLSKAISRQLSGLEPRSASGALNKSWRRKRLGQTLATVDTGLAAKLVLILPLLICGALKTVRRNIDWRDEISLFRSNLHESGSRSLANLATALQNAQPQLGQQLVPLYRAALELEPSSADHHYNLALALQHQHLATSAGEVGDWKDERLKLEVVGHYRAALTLRPGFGLAALNMGWFLWKELERLDEAIESWHECGFGMNATRSRNHQQQARVAIECLISGAKLHLFGLHENSSSTGSWPSQREAAPEKQTTSVGAQPTPSSATTTTTATTKNGPAGCLAAVEWLHSARLKAIKLLELGGPSAPTGSELQRIGDLHKQLATILWLEARCLSGDVETRARLELSIRHAFESQVSIPVEIYVDSARSRSEPAAALHLLDRAILGEQVKRDLSQQERRSRLAELRRARALVLLDRLARPDDALAEVKRALELKPTNSEDYLALAGRLSHESGHNEEAERFYMRALQTLADGRLDKVVGRERLSGRKLAWAHANYGAILQVNGRFEKARTHYRLALDCDPNNVAASSNIKRLV